MAWLWAWALGEECGRRSGCCRVTLWALVAVTCAGLPLASVGLGLADWDLCPGEPWLPLFSVVGGAGQFGLHLLCVLCGVACGKGGWIAGSVVWACGVAANWSVFLGVFYHGRRGEGWGDLTAPPRDVSQWPKAELGCSERLAKFHVAVSLGLGTLPTVALGVLSAFFLLHFLCYALFWINGWDFCGERTRRRSTRRRSTSP